MKILVGILLLFFPLFAYADDTISPLGKRGLFIPDSQKVVHSYTGHIVFGKQEYLSRYGGLGLQPVQWLKFGLTAKKDPEQKADELIRQLMFSSEDYSEFQFLKRGNPFVEKRILFDYRVSNSLSFGAIIPSSNIINSLGGIGPRIKYSDGDTTWGGGVYVDKSGNLGGALVYHLRF